LSSDSVIVVLDTFEALPEGQPPLVFDGGTEGKDRLNMTVFLRVVIVFIVANIGRRTFWKVGHWDLLIQNKLESDEVGEGHKYSRRCLLY
jgi:hypothetical protein